MEKEILCVTEIGQRELGRGKASDRVLKTTT